MKSLIRSLWRDKVALVSLTVVVALAVLSVAVSIGVGSSQVADVSMRLKPPSWGAGHPLGTDGLGRDLLVRVLLGIRTELLIGVVSVLISLVIGTVLGILAGYFGGFLDSVVVFLTDTQLSFPSLLIAIVFLEVLGHSIGSVIVVLGLSFWMIFSREARQATISIKSAEYVEIARTMGVPTRKILLSHVLRNIWPGLISVVGIELPRIIMGEVSLSFLGFGVNPPHVSLGQVLGDGAQYLTLQWWISTFAGLAVTILVLSLSLFGLWLQKTMDPLRHGRELVSA